jgi:hypothetical protein
MNKDATVSREDLGKAIDLLEGLATILFELNEEKRAEETEGNGDALVAKLGNLIDEHRQWESLRYQPGVGMGWYHLAQNVEVVRGRLLAGYSDASL